MLVNGFRLLMISVLVGKLLGEETNVERLSFYLLSTDQRAQGAPNYKRKINYTSCHDLP